MVLYSNWKVVLPTLFVSFSWCLFVLCRYAFFLFSFSFDHRYLMICFDISFIPFLAGIVLRDSKRQYQVIFFFPHCVTALAFCYIYFDRRLFTFVILIWKSGSDTQLKPVYCLFSCVWKQRQGLTLIRVLNWIFRLALDHGLNIFLHHQWTESPFIHIMGYIPPEPPVIKISSHEVSTIVPHVAMPSFILPIKVVDPWDAPCTRATVAPDAPFVSKP
jgi:hypothetical protein